jgi:hypothetical protein
MKKFYNAADLHREFPKILEVILNITGAELEYTLECEKLSDEFGGDVFILESEKELADVRGLSSGGNTLENSNLENDVPAFDVAERTDEGYFFLLCTNNAGGDMYVVPLEIGDLSDNVKRAAEPLGWRVL